MLLSSYVLGGRYCSPYVSSSYLLLHLPPPLLDAALVVAVQVEAVRAADGPDRAKCYRNSLPNH